MEGRALGGLRRVVRGEEVRRALGDAALRAERLCPTAEFVAPDFKRYRDVSRQIREIFRRHTDLVEPLSLDEAYLDVTVEKTGLATATETAVAIRAAIREETALTAAAGVALNKFLAKTASDWKKPDGLCRSSPARGVAFLERSVVAKLPASAADRGRARGTGNRTVPICDREMPASSSAASALRSPALTSSRAASTTTQFTRPDRQIDPSEETFETDLAIEALDAALAHAAERVYAAARKRELAGAR